jgi:hypothetical protein
VRRRDFLGGAAAALSSIGAGAAPATTPKTRAAIVIGVNKAGTLPVLRAAVSGAEQMATWLSGQNFDVTSFLDSVRPVRISDIVDRVADIVDKGIYEQLVIYFAGHGCVNGSYSEVWFLSGAPVRSIEAVNVTNSVQRARQSGIANVVFISDACRSRPDSIQIGNVTGGEIFPNNANLPPRPSYVDEFYAARPGEAALELPVDQSTKNYEGIYTSVFLDAFHHPTADMVIPVNGVRVVPNRRLEKFLTSGVSKRAEAVSLQLSQYPECYVPSPDQTYIGRVAADAIVVASAAPPLQTIHDVAALSIRGALDARSPTLNAREFGYVAGFDRFSTSVSQILDTPQTSPIQTRTGFTVTGTRVAGITVSPGFEGRLIESGNFVAIEISGRDRPSGSIALRFADGTGGVFAILSGFIADVTVGDTGVSNINYNPARDNSRYQSFEAEKPRLDLLRASVAAAAKFGALNIGAGQEAEAWGDRIRILKGVDPTLGLYAAYAYDRAGNSSKAKSVSDFLADDLGTEFFDTAMLAGKLDGKPFQDRSAAPFVPMLALGWDALLLRRVQLDPRLLDARSRLRPALWTTFAPQDMDLVSDLVRTS